jgi:hypothetical protein
MSIVKQILFNRRWRIFRNELIAVYMHLKFRSTFSFFFFFNQWLFSYSCQHAFRHNNNLQPLNEISDMHNNCRKLQKSVDAICTRKKQKLEKSSCSLFRCGLQTSKLHSIANTENSSCWFFLCKKSCIWTVKLIHKLGYDLFGLKMQTHWKFKSVFVLWFNAWASRKKANFQGFFCWGDRLKSRVNEWQNDNQRFVCKSFVKHRKTKFVEVWKFLSVVSVLKMKRPLNTSITS